jgi:dephospho-CoA kinase
MSFVSSPRFCDRFCIGLTGGIASGKSTASECLGQLGAAVVDTDVIAHQLTHAGGAAMPAIEHAFGKGFINLDGSLNRTAMRALVFAEPLKRSLLEAILHPMIHAKTRELGATVKGEYVVFVVPLLVESSRWRQRVDRIAVVDCDPKIQLKRLLQRPTMTTVQAAQIMAAQASREQRLTMADDVIVNDVDKAELIRKIDSYHVQCLGFSRAHTQGASAKLA